MEHVSLDLHAAIPVRVATDGGVVAFSPFADGPFQWFATSPTVIVAAPSEGDARGLFALTQHGNA